VRPTVALLLEPAVLLLLAAALVALAGADGDVDEVLLVTEDEHAVRIATASARTTPAATRNRGREVRRPAEGLHRE
jgi:hypothetical protein